MRSGEIYLYSQNGTVLRRSYYDTRAIRTAVMKSWNKLYGKRIDDCFYHIIPNVNPERVKDDGTNGTPESQCYLKKDYHRPPA